MSIKKYIQGLKFPSDFLFNKLNYAILGSGFLLRLVIYARQRTVFLDESNLIRNWCEKSYIELWAALDYEQYAPPIFSCLGKLGIQIFGVNDLSVRLIPLIAGLGVLFLFYKIGQEIFSPWILSLALPFVAWSPLFLEYSTECKQYSTDALVALTLLYFALKRPVLDKKQGWFWAILGSFCIWLSMPSVFGLAAVSVYFFWKNEFKLDFIKRYAPLALLWLVQFGLYFFILLKKQADNASLAQFHSSYFLVFPPKDWASVKLLGSQLEGFFYLSTGRTALSVLFLLVGVFLAFYKNKKSKLGLLILCTLPIFLTFGTSAFGYYSLIKRMVLFLVPSMLLLAFWGYEHHLRQAKNWAKWSLTLVGIVVLVDFNHLYAFFKPLRSDYAATKTGIDFLEKNYQKNDLVFAHFNVAPELYYYTQLRDNAYQFDAVYLQKYRCCSPTLLEDDLKILIEKKEHQRIWLLYNLRDLALPSNAIEALGGRQVEKFDFPRGRLELYEF